MSTCSRRLSPFLVFLALLIFPAIANAQGQPLLQISRSRASLDDQSNMMSSGRNVYDATLRGQQLDVRQYPNSSACVLVYPNGKYIVEKRDEHSVGHPKMKSAEGTLTPDDLQRLKAMLDDQELIKVRTPPAPELPPDTQAIREAERLDVQISRAADLQQFTLTKERVNTGTTNAVSSSASLTGMDTYLDNGAQYKKTLAPLVKWFDELAKKNKFTDAKSQLCQ